MGDKPDFLKPLELRPILRLGKNAIYEGIRTGQIPSIKVGDRYLIPRRKIETMMGKDGGLT
jgi:excisionase family DNA binding protein